MVVFEIIRKAEIQSRITKFWKNNQKFLLSGSILKNQGIFFRNPSRTQIVTLWGH